MKYLEDEYFQKLLNTKDTYSVNEFKQVIGEEIEKETVNRISCLMDYAKKETTTKDDILTRLEWLRENILSGLGFIKETEDDLFTEKDGVFFEKRNY